MTTTIKEYKELCYITTYDWEVYVMANETIASLEKKLESRLLNVGNWFIAVSSIKKVEIKSADDVDNRIIQIQDPDLRESQGWIKEEASWWLHDQSLNSREHYCQTLKVITTVSFYSLCIITMWIIRKQETNGTFIKIRSKTAPSLVISSKNEQGEWIDEDIRAVEGNVVGIYFTSRVSGETKEEIETVNIKIKDGEEMFILQSAWTFPMRSIANSILGAGDQLGRIRIGIYGKINGDKTYPAVTFKNNDVRVNRLLDIDQQKELITPVLHPKTQKVEKYDYSDLNAFFKEKLLELDARLRESEENDVIDELFPEEPEEEKKMGVAETIKARSATEEVDEFPF